MTLRITKCLQRYQNLQWAMTTLLMFTNLHPVIGLPLCRTTSSEIPQSESNVIERLDDVCTTPSCVNTASEVLKRMNFKVDPCDNFYQFICGGFLNSTIIPDDEVSVNNFGLIGDKVQQQLRMSIEKPGSPEESKAFRLVRELYRTCMNKTEIEEQGLNPLIEILEKLGGWPVLVGEKWDDSRFNWIEATYMLSDLGYTVDYLMAVDIDVNLENNTRYVFAVDQGSTMNFSKSVRKAYLNCMVDIAVMMGAEKEYAQNELKDILNFEKKLNKISLPAEERRNFTVLNNWMTVSDLTENYPSIPWKDYFNRLLPSNIQIDETEVVNINVPIFIESLEKLMIETPKRIQANYMMWKTVEASLLYLNDEIRKRWLEFSTKITGETEMGLRWKECVAIVDEELSTAVAALYVRNHVDSELKKNAIEMVREIHDQFKKILGEVDWMDDETKKRALEKVASMSSRIAFPEELLDDSELDKYYKGLELSKGNYLQSMLNVSLFENERTFGHLKEPVDKNDWLLFESPTTVNAYNSIAENTMELPAGILQGSFFSLDRPMYMNYGAIGSIIGHEITHSFDDEGRQFDKDGNLVDWWDPSTDEKYRRKIECIINQYGNYSVEGIGKLNGINTQGENVADNGGIKMAYLAYKNWSSRKKPEPKLPGLDYSPAQMFWISTASTWCSKDRPETLRIHIADDGHSPDEFRIIGPFSNIPEFSSDFKCSVGSKMNPQNKCVLW